MHLVKDLIQEPTDLTTELTGADGILTRLSRTLRNWRLFWACQELCQALRHDSRNYVGLEK